MVLTGRPAPGGRAIARAGLMLALTLLFQSLRFVLPLPPGAAMFVIGVLVNGCLLTALFSVGKRAAIAIAITAPFVAYLQQGLPLPILIVPVAAGNIVYIWLIDRLFAYHRVAAAVAAAAGKTAALYISCRLLLKLLLLPDGMASAILWIMSWPQFITGLGGAALAAMLARRAAIR